MLRLTSATASLAPPCLLLKAPLGELIRHSICLLECLSLVGKVLFVDAN